MATLILTCSTGQGHNSCACALRDYYEGKGETCEIADALGFASQALSHFICWGHVTMYRHFHSLFQIGYHFSEKHDGVLGENSFAYKMLTKGTDRIRDYIVKGGFDSVICTHIFGSLMMTEVQKKYHLPITTSLVATDYTCSPGTKDSRVDLYFIPDPPLSVYYECPEIAEESVISSGIPIRQMFYHSVPGAEAKAAFGIPASHRHLIMMCGSMGCGPMKELTRRLAKELSDSCDLSIVCGTNKALQKKLTKKYGKKKNIHILGYVDDMSLLMDSADLYLTKPGGISVTESAMKNLPMVFIDAVAGCEEYNKIYFIKKRTAQTETTPKGITNVCLDLLSKPRKLEKMRKNLESDEKHNAAEIIYREMHRVAAQKAGAADPV